MKIIQHNIFDETKGVFFPVELSSLSADLFKDWLCIKLEDRFDLIITLDRSNFFDDKILAVMNFVESSYSGIDIYCSKDFNRVRIVYNSVIFITVESLLRDLWPCYEQAVFSFVRGHEIEVSAEEIVQFQIEEIHKVYNTFLSIYKGADDSIVWYKKW